MSLNTRKITMEIESVHGLIRTFAMIPLSTKGNNRMDRFTQDLVNYAHEDGIEQVFLDSDFRIEEKE